MKRGALVLLVVGALAIAAVVGLERWIASSNAPQDGGGVRALAERNAFGRAGVGTAEELATAAADAREAAQRNALVAQPPESESGASGAPSAGGGTWRGRVIDARTSAPIEGVVVGWIGAAERVEARTNSEGRFELACAEAGRGRADFRHPDYAHAARPDVDSAIERAWELWPAASIEGRVQTSGAAGGEPIEVCLWSTSGPPDVDPDLTIQPAAGDGTFRFEGLTPGVYALMADSPSAAPSVRGGLALGAGGALRVELELERGGLFEGRVLERAARTGVADATVELTWDSSGLPAVVLSRLTRSATTAEDGHFSLEGLAAGAHQAVVQAPWGSRVEQDLFLERPGDRLERDVFVGLCATLTGSVRAPQGGAVAGARVALFDVGRLAELGQGSPTGRVTATTAADGSFELTDIPPRERMILIAFPPSSSALCASEPRTVDLRPDEERQAFDVELGAGCILRGRVEDGDGRPIGGALVELQHRSKIGDWDGASVTAAADGRFEFEPLPAGRAALTVSALGFAPLSTKARLRVEREFDETLRLRAATSVSGFVVDSEGWGIPYARVRLKRIGTAPAGAPKRESLRESADEFGAFRFDAVPDGRWVPDAALEGWAVERVEPSEIAVPSDVQPRIVMNPDLRRSVVVRGSVLVDGRDEPRGLSLEGLSGLKVIDGGRFTISGMAAGRSKLTVRASNAMPRTVRLDLTSGGEVDVGEIELVHGTQLTVRLTGPDRRPVRKATARLEPAKAPPKSRRGRYGVPAATKLGERKAGQYGDLPVLPGRWRLLIEAPGFQPVEKSIRVRSRKRQVVPVELER